MITVHPTHPAPEPAAAGARAGRRACVLGLLLAAGASRAAAEPGQPVRIVVPYPPGGASDRLARVVAEGLGRELRTRFIVDNRAGAAGQIGMRWAARAPADGQTLAIGTVSTLAIAAADAADRFDAVAPIAAAPLYVVVNAALPVPTLDALLAWARARPGQLFYASVGEHSLPHLVGQRFCDATGITMVHVPYVGAPAARMDLLAGRVHLMFDQLATFTEAAFAGGRLRALAVMASQRQAVLPDAPTLAELGWPGLEFSFWAGLVAPRGTPPDIRQRLDLAMQRLLADPAVDRALRQLGLTPQPGSARAFERWVLAETARWQALVAATTRPPHTTTR